MINWIHLLIALSCTTFAGWLVAWLTIRIIFNPIQPKKIFGLTTQGLLPKNQAAIAANAGKLAAQEFRSFNGIEEKIMDPATFAQLKPELEKHIDFFLREKLKVSFPMLSVFIGDKTINQLKMAFLTEVEELFPTMMLKYVGQMKKDIDVEKIIANKINSIDPAALRTQFFGVAKKEIRSFQLFAALIGFVVGIFQVIILVLLR